MNIRTAAVTAATLGLSLLPSAIAENEEKLTADQQALLDKVSYFLGSDAARRFQSGGIQIQPALFAAGMNDVVAGKDPKFTEEELQGALATYQAQLQEEDAKKASMAAEKNAGEGIAYLEKNGKREGVKSTESGLQDEILKAGEGAKPSRENSVTVHYTGTLIDGTVFDSSVQRGEPATFGVGQVIPGWTEALQLMSEGSKWKLFIPSELAYGKRGAGADIGPDATLIFEVELLKVN